MEKIEGRRLEKPLGAAAEFNFSFFFAFACVDMRRESKTHKHTHANGHKSQKGGASRQLGGCSHAQPSFHFESITLIPEISARIAPTNEYFLFDFPPR